MDITLPLDQMSTAEKLRAMDALWADLSRNEVSPMQFIIQCNQTLSLFKPSWTAGAILSGLDGG